MGQQNQHRLIASTNRIDDLGTVHTSNNSTANDSKKASTSSLPKHSIQLKTVSNKRRLRTPQHIIDAIKENCIYQGAGKRRQLDINCVNYMLWCPKTPFIANSL